MSLAALQRSSAKSKADLNVDLSLRASRRRRRPRSAPVQQVWPHAPLIPSAHTDSITAPMTINSAMIVYLSRLLMSRGHKANTMPPSSARVLGQVRPVEAGSRRLQACFSEPSRGRAEAFVTGPLAYLNVATVYRFASDDKRRLCGDGVGARTPSTATARHRQRACSSPARAKVSLHEGA